jgi:spore germination protein GerM
VQTEQVRLYFIASGQLTYVTQALPQPATPQVIVAALQAGPQGDAAVTLRSAVPSADEDEIRVSVDAGIATVELPPTFFDTIALPDQRLVIGQIVLTLTDSRGVGQVTFNVAVPKPTGELVPAGSLLSRNDFEALLDSATVIDDPVNATTTSTTLPAP